MMMMAWIGAEVCYGDGQQKLSVWLEFYKQSFYTLAIVLGGFILGSGSKELGVENTH